MEHVEYLSKELGARPAGTEEEQEAALYIADQFKKESNYHAEIEEFTCSSNFPFMRGICCAIIIVATIAAMIVPVLAIPAFVLSLASAAIYILEALDKPIVTRALARSASQNVVAKYKPFSENDTNRKSSGRSRKIVLVAHYDSGKVTPPLVDRIESMGAPIGLICAGATALATLLLLVRIVAGSMNGIGAIFFNVITIIVLLVVALPLVKTILVQTAPYNEGANNNASGVAAMLEVARRISSGSVSEADLADEAEGVAIHGEAAAIANGLVPEGAEIRYEAERLVPPEIEPLDEEERLLSAKAAIAALTGKPVERYTYGSVASHLVNSRVEDGVSTAGEGEAEGTADGAAASASGDTSAAPWNQDAWKSWNEESETGAEGYDNAPSWFVSAQQKAKKPTGQTGPIQKSRYNEAIEQAEREQAERERQRIEEERAMQEAALREREQAAREAMLAAEAARQAERAPEPARFDEYEQAPEPVEDLSYESAPRQESAFTAVDEPVEQPIEAEAEVLPPDATIAVAPISTADLAADIAAALETDGAREAATKAAPEKLYEAEEQVEEEVATRPSRRRIESLPDIEGGKKKRKDTTSPSRSGLFRRLRADVPSLSGVIRMQEAGEDVSQKPVRRPERVVVPEIDAAADAAAPAADDVDYDMEIEYNDVFSPQKANSDGTSRRWNGGALSRLRLGRVDTRLGDEPVEEEEEEVVVVEEEEGDLIAEEIESIYHFRNPLYNSEIWFVAVGCDNDTHDGALAFINEHQSELRGAMIIEVESLGQGDLGYSSEEGRFLKSTTSSRIKRFTRKAQAATGMNLSSISLAGKDSIASTAQKAGFQSMHLFGIEDGAIALKGSSDDVLENLDEEVLDDNVNFLMELLKHN